MKVILIHGSHHKQNCWDNFKKVLIKDNYEIICYELLGHGNKSDDKTYTIQQYAEDLNIFLKKYDTKIIIIAHSLGCLVTYYYLLNYKWNKYIYKLFFIAPAINTSIIKMPYNLIINLLYTGQLCKNTYDVRDLLFNNKTEQKVIDLCYKNLEIRDHTNQFSVILFSYNYKTFDEIPIYLIASKNDKITNSEGVKNLNKIFPKSKYVSFDISGHDMMLDIEWNNVLDYIKENFEIKGI